jgi:hypothetical protein
VDLYIHSPIRLDGIMLNSLSTGTTLPLLLLMVCVVSVFVQREMSILVNKRRM